MVPKISRDRRRHGFTLIELLIVVAIIAILAAIAVPNFLEAQTRSKVSRARTDLRTVATGLESYAVDHNKYPPMLGAPPNGQAENQNNGYGSSRRNAWRGVPQQLTTPVAYLSSVPQDVFKIGGTNNRTPDTGLSYASGNLFDMTFIYHNIAQFAADPGSGFNEGDIADYGYWRMYSLGPDKIFNTIGTLDTTLGWIYDSTNGTISSGEILRTQRDTLGQIYTRFP
ncbi:MAG: type II secretion system protein [Candidatus Sumerlaeaceae bacterium]